MSKPSKKARTPKRARTERRFEPRSTANPIVVQGIGALGAAALGAGFYGQFVRAASPIAQAMPFAHWVLATGAVLVGGAVWLGTSGEPALRVGDAGVGLEKGGVRHIPWSSVENVRLDKATDVLTIRGADEAGSGLVIVASLRSQPQAVAWIVKEARTRVPSVVEVDEGYELPEARPDAGESIALEPLQVVGKRCAATEKVIAYEPDARVCPRCERVYHKAHVPETCACGGSLEALRPRKAAASESEELSDKAANSA